MSEKKINGEKFLKQANEEYAKFKEDVKAYEEEIKEFEEWDVTLLDGLE